MKENPICNKCEFKKVKTYENLSDAYCEHPDREHIEQMYKESKSHGKVGFLGYVKPWDKEHQVYLKTSPRWCPKKVKNNGGV